MASGSDVRVLTRARARVRWRDAVVERGLVSMIVALGTSVVIAQPVFSERDLDSAMKTVGRNVQLMQTAIAAGDVEAAKVRVARAREQLSPTVSFWRNRKESDALGLLKQAVAALDAVDAALSSVPVDPGVVGSAATTVSSACQSCHAVYREQDATSKGFSVRKLR